MDRIDRELLRRAWDCLDTFKQAYPENWHEEDEQVMKDLMAADVEFTQRHDPWKNVALRLGEELSSVGPDGYYDMHPGVWLNWAMAQQPRGKTSLPQRTWVGLTDEQKLSLEIQGGKADVMLAELVEQWLKEKNT